MARTIRTYFGWMSVLVMVAVTASCLTWFFIRRMPESRGQILSGTAVADFFQVRNSGAHCLLKVRPPDSTVNDHLTWDEEWNNCPSIFLDESKEWITVNKRGVYLVFLQVTYELEKRNDSSSTVHLRLIVNFNYTEGSQQFASAFDTRQVTEETQDARLSFFILLNMKAGERFSVSAVLKDRIMYDDFRPMSTFITIVRYSDWTNMG